MRTTTDESLSVTFLAIYTVFQGEALKIQLPASPSWVPVWSLRALLSFLQVKQEDGLNACG